MTEQEAEEIIRRDNARSLAVSSRIAEAERRAKERLKRRSSSSKNLVALFEAFQTPGLRSARDFNASMAFKTASRPKAPDTGGVTFHFSVTYVSKTNRTVAAYAGRAPSGSAEQHEAYIEREGAAETFIDPEARSFDQDQAADGQEYIERPSASEKSLEEDGIIVSSFGNIADTKEERLEFWKKLEEIEQSPKGHKFTINPFRGADFWQAVERHERSGGEVPAPFVRAKQHCVNEVSPLEITLKDEEAVTLLKFARSMGDFQKDGALKVSLGRGGRVQTRIIAELPHEITPAQRLALAKEYCAEFDGLGLPYWAVIHAPDRHNDRRNYHIHIALSERPAKQMRHPATGKVVWDFEVAETYKNQWRHVRTHYPFAQERLRAMNDKRWIGIERRRYCNTLNKVLERSGSTKRYDPRSYEAMGLTQKAKKRIDSKMYAKERKGQQTEQGVEAARQQWEAAAADLQRQAKDAARQFVEMSYKNRRFLNVLHAAEHPEAGAFQHAIRKAADLHSMVISGVVAKQAANFIADKMVSRARLKEPRKRTKVDKILIEVASEIRTIEVKHFDALIARFSAEYREQAVKIAKVQSDYIKQYQKLMFDQIVRSIAPVQGAVRRTVDAVPRMTMEQLEAMTASWFPKHTSLSDRAPEAPKKVDETSAVDRYLGKNFFNPKNVGKMPERSSKTTAPQPRQPVPAVAPEKTASPPPPIAPEKPVEVRSQTPTTPGPVPGEKPLPERPAAPARPPRAPAPDVMERAPEREPATTSGPKPKPQPAPAVDKKETENKVVLGAAPPPSEIPAPKKRKKRNDEVIEQVPVQKKPAVDQDARRRAMIARNKRDRGNSR
jgi:hypothetical protein